MIYKERVNRQRELDRQQEHWNEVHENLLAVQKKSLEVSDPNDADEKEADAVARKVADGTFENELAKKTINVRENLAGNFVATELPHIDSWVVRSTTGESKSEDNHCASCEGMILGIDSPTFFDIANAIELRANIKNHTPESSYDFKRTFERKYWERTEKDGVSEWVQTRKNKSSATDDATDDDEYLIPQQSKESPDIYYVYSKDRPGLPKRQPHTIRETREIIAIANFVESLEITVGGKKHTDPKTQNWHSRLWIKWIPDEGWKVQVDKSSIGKDHVSLELPESEKKETKKTQKKSLSISDPQDADEKEADAVAQKVVNGQSAEIHGTGSTINRKGEGSAETTPEFQSKLESNKGSGQSLDDATKSEMESKMGADFSRVKIHTGSEAHNMSESINAKAFTHGQDVFFMDGQFDTNSKQGKELLAHELTHTVQQGGGNSVSRSQLIQRVDIPTAQNYKTFADFENMKLGELDDYAKAQADWHASPSLTEPERADIRKVLNFIRTSGVAAGIADLYFKDLNDTLKAELVPGETFKYLKVIGQAAATSDPFKYKTTGTVEETVFAGKKLEKMIDTIPRFILRTAMFQTQFDKFSDMTLVDSLVKYYKESKPTPAFQSESDDLTNNDFAAFLDLKMVKDPLDYNKGPLKNRVRDYHKFEPEALEKLEVNFNDKSKTKPVTLILHSSFDHNGAFIRDHELTKTILTNPYGGAPAISVLMVEGQEKLAGYRKLVSEIAKEYAPNEKLDQVLIAGHGNNNAMELAGELKEDKKKKTKSGKENPDYGKIKEVGDDIDVENNKRRTRKLFDTILKNMDTKKDGISSPTKEPHRRILFNACLTNSHDVDWDILNDDPVKSRNSIEKWLKKNKNLVEYMESRGDKLNSDDVTVIGALASFGSVGLMNSSNELDLQSSYDPYFTTKNKIDYVVNGKDTTGVLRAVMDIWSSKDVTTQNDLFAKMAVRAAGPGMNWDEIIIKTSFKIILDKYKTDAYSINMISNVVLFLEECDYSETCRVSLLKRVTDYISDIDTIIFFNALKNTSDWSDNMFIPVVFYQVWIHLDPKNIVLQNDFLSQINSYDTIQDAQEFIDPEYFNDHFAALLAVPYTSAKLKLALLGFRVHKETHQSDCKDYLLAQLDANNKFPSTLVPSVEEIMSGVATEDDVLKALGKLKEVPKTDKDANVTVENKPTENTLYMESVTYEGITRRKTKVFENPDTKATEVGTLKDETMVHILGSKANWWAIEYEFTSGKIGTAFIAKSHVKVLKT